MSQFQYNYDKRKFVLGRLKWRVFLEEFPPAMVAAQGYRHTVALFGTEIEARLHSQMLNSLIEEERCEDVGSDVLPRAPA